MSAFVRGGMGTQAEIDAAKAAAIAAGLGVGQARVDLISSRVIGVVYTNATGKPIEVSVGIIGYPPSVTSFYNNSVRTAYLNLGVAGSAVSGSFIVAAGSQYWLANDVGANTLAHWSELR